MFDQSTDDEHNGIIFMFDIRPTRKIVSGRKYANLSDLKLLYVNANPMFH